MADNKLNLLVKFTGIDKLSSSIRNIMGAGKSGAAAMRALRGQVNESKSAIRGLNGEIRSNESELARVRGLLRSGSMQGGLALAERELVSAIGEANRKIREQEAAMAQTNREIDRQKVRLERVAAVQAQAGKVAERAGKAGAVASVAITAPLIAFGKHALEAASNAYELQSAFDVTFGKNAAAMTSWAQTTAAALGRSNVEIEQAANTFGIFFNQADPAKSAKMSQQFAVLAQDLSSFYNVDPGTALEKAALRPYRRGRTAARLRHLPQRRCRKGAGPQNGDGAGQQAVHRTAKDHGPRLADHAVHHQRPGRCHAHQQLHRQPGPRGGRGVGQSQRGGGGAADPCHHPAGGHAHRRDQQVCRALALHPQMGGDPGRGRGCPWPAADRRGRCGRRGRRARPAVPNLGRCGRCRRRCRGGAGAAAGGASAGFGAMALSMLPLLAGLALLAGAAYLIYSNWGTITGFFTGVWNTIKTAVTSNWTTIRNVLLGGVVIFMPLVAAAMLLASVIYRNWDAIKAATMTMISAVAGVVAPILAPFKAVVTFLGGLAGQFFGYGVNIIGGLIKGIVSMAGTVIKTVLGIAGSIGSKFAEALGIHSPSRLFMQMGGHINEGLGLGLERGQGRPVRAVGRMAGAVAGAGAMALAPAAAPARGAPPAKTEYHFHITQMPGENSQALARRLADLVQKAHDDERRRDMGDDF